uniref:Uncharacterized protein n=1 Tax=Opuntia streptacantha TaxID=393608 RepID=A0A7C8YNH5_OPUST
MSTKPPKNPEKKIQKWEKKRGGDEERESEKVMNKVWDCGSPLYDSYELATLTHLIERHLMALPNSLGGSKRFRLSRHNHNQNQKMMMMMVNQGSTAVMVSSSNSRKPSMQSGCVGLGRVWKRMRGERGMKIIKPTRCRPPGIKWFI